MLYSVIQSNGAKEKCDLSVAESADRHPFHSRYFCFFRIIACTGLASSSRLVKINDRQSDKRRARKIIDYYYN